MKVWLKVIRNGALAGALIGFLWGSGLLTLIGIFWGRSRGRARDWPGHDFDPGYLDRLWTYPLYGLAVGILIACLLGINKDLRYIITKTEPDDGKGSHADRRPQS